MAMGGESIGHGSGEPASSEELNLDLQEEMQNSKQAKHIINKKKEQRSITAVFKTPQNTPAKKEEPIKLGKRKADYEL